MEREEEIFTVEHGNNNVSPDNSPDTSEEEIKIRHIKDWQHINDINESDTLQETLIKLKKQLRQNIETKFFLRMQIRELEEIIKIE